MPEDTKDADLARISHLAVRVDELAELIRGVYLPSANRLSSSARPGGRRLVEELTHSLERPATEVATGTLAAIIVATDTVLSGDTSA
jgi:hypothetical protein